LESVNCVVLDDAEEFTELGEWVKSNVDYGRRLVGSGIEERVPAG